MAYPIEKGGLAGMRSVGGWGVQDGGRGQGGVDARFFGAICSGDGACGGGRGATAQKWFT